MTDSTDRARVAPSYTEARRAHDAAEGLRELADFVEQHPQFAGAIEGQRFLLATSNDAERFTMLARQLGGRRAKDADDTWFRVVRKFGPIAVQVYAYREVVCEKVVVGHEDVVETAVACVHCEVPIAVKPGAQDDDGGAYWVHVTDDGWYRICKDGGDVATPPSFESTVKTVEVVEWRCDPVLDAPAASPC